MASPSSTTTGRKGPTLKSSKIPEMVDPKTGQPLPFTDLGAVEDPALEKLPQATLKAKLRRNRKSK